MMGKMVDVDLIKVFIGFLMLLLVVTILFTVFSNEGVINLWRADVWCEARGLEQHPSFPVSRCLAEDSCYKNAVGARVCDYSKYVMIPAEGGIE